MLRFRLEPALRHIASVLRDVVREPNAQRIAPEEARHLRDLSIENRVERARPRDAVAALGDLHTETTIGAIAGIYGAVGVKSLDIGVTVTKWVAGHEDLAIGLHDDMVPKAAAIGHELAVGVPCRVERAGLLRL